MQKRVSHLSQLEVVGDFGQQSGELNIFPQMNIEKNRSIVTFISDGTQTPSVSSAMKYIWLTSVVLCIRHNP